MTSLTHAAVGAVAGTRIRNFGLALAVSFATHFLLDAIYHFKAFYELEVPGRWTHRQATVTLFLALAIPGLAAMVWIWRRNRQVVIFAGYGCAMVLVDRVQRWQWELIWALLLTAIWYLLAPNPLTRRWVICGFAAYLPDLLKSFIPAIAFVHKAAHHRTVIGMGDWVSRLGRGNWQIPPLRALDPYYQIGYGLEILMEAAILYGCLYWLVRHGSAADRSTLGHRADPIDEENLIPT